MSITDKDRSSVDTIEIRNEEQSLLDQSPTTPNIDGIDANSNSNNNNNNLINGKELQNGTTVNKEHFTTSYSNLNNNNNIREPRFFERCSTPIEQHQQCYMPSYHPGFVGYPYGSNVVSPGGILNNNNSSMSSFTPPGGDAYLPPIHQPDGGTLHIPHGYPFYPIPSMIGGVRTPVGHVIQWSNSAGGSRSTSSPINNNIPSPPTAPNPTDILIRKPTSASPPPDGSVVGKRRTRKAYSREQLMKLESVFQENNFLTRESRAELSVLLGLNERQVKIWFQNRRMKEKKRTATRMSTDCIISCNRIPTIFPTFHHHHHHASGVEIPRSPLEMSRPPINMPRPPSAASSENSEIAASLEDRRKNFESISYQSNSVAALPRQAGMLVNRNFIPNINYYRRVQYPNTQHLV